MTRSLVRWVHRRLVNSYGQPAWEPNDAPVDELVSTILSQHTSDLNAQRAFDALRSAFSGWEAVRDAPVDQLSETIRRGGLAVVKAHRIQAVLRALTDICKAPRPRCEVCPLRERCATGRVFSPG